MTTSATPQHVDVHQLADWIGVRFTSDWTLIDQERINAFAEVTGDHMWFHVDVERSRAFRGTTIAHGLLTLTLLPGLGYQVMEVTGHEHALNYGLDRVRYTGIVPVDSRVRLHLAIAEVEPKGDGILVRYDFEFEREGEAKPVVIGRTVAMYFPKKPA